MVSQAVGFFLQAIGHKGLYRFGRPPMVPAALAEQNGVIGCLPGQFMAEHILQLRLDGRFEDELRPLQRRQPVA